MLQIGLFVSLELYVKTVALPDYVGAGDVIAHEYYSQVIVDTGFASSSSGFYSQFPAFHVMVAEIDIVSGGHSPLLALRGLFCVGGFILPFILYGISGLVNRNPRFRMIVCAVASNGFVVLNQFGQGITSTLVFIFFMFLVFSVLRIDNTPRSRMFAIPFALILVFTHQPNVFMCIVLLFFAVVIYSSYLNERRPNGRPFKTLTVADADNEGSREHEWTNHKMRPTAQMSAQLLFVVAFATIVTAYSAFTSLDFVEQFMARPQGSLDIPSRMTSEPPPLQNLVASGMMSLGMSALLFLSFCFTLMCLHGGICGTMKRFRYIGVAVGMVSIALYLVGLLRFVPLLTFYLNVQRTAIYLEFVLVLLSVVFLCRFLLDKSSKRGVSAAILLFLMLIGGVINLPNTDDTRDLGVIGVKPMPVLSKDDKAVLLFVVSSSYNSTVQTDYYSYAYLSARGIDCIVGTVDANGSVELYG
ncbi:MAG: hypothetical protein JSV90_08655, partial [Methanobacteriota archaeon]